MTTFKPTRKRLEQKVRRIIRKGSGLPINHVIPGNKNAPKSFDGSFAVVTLINDIRLGYPYYKYRDDPSETQEISWESRLATYNIVYFGDEIDGENVTEYPQNFQTWIISTEGILYQQRNDIDIKSHTDIRQSDEHSDIWESRAGMDIEISYKRVATREIGWVDNVDIFVHHRDNPSIDETIQIRRT